MKRSAAPAVRWRGTAASAGETAALGETLGRAAPPGAVLLLEGPLGAGKTTLAQGVGSGCGVREPITSPTYNLILHYHGDRPFTHVDLYRLADEDELATLDLDEILGGDGVTCVEWPDLLRGRVGPPWGAIRLTLVAGRPDVRRIEGSLVGAGWEETRNALEERGERTEDRT